MRVAFPGKNSLSDFFRSDSFSIIEPAARRERTEVMGFDGELSIQLGGHISGDRFRCFQAIPNENVLKWIGENMLAIQHDTIYFEIVEGDDGFALLLAKYNQIIGSRWLGFFPTSELP